MVVQGQNLREQEVARLKHEWLKHEPRLPALELELAAHRAVMLCRGQVPPEAHPMHFLDQGGVSPAAHLFQIYRRGGCVAECIRQNASQWLARASS